MRMPAQDTVGASGVPSRRVNASLVGTPAGVVLVGGDATPSNYQRPAASADTWVWDGRAWTRLADSPQPSAGRAAAFDQDEGNAMFFGGAAVCSGGSTCPPPLVYGTTHSLSAGRFPGVTPAGGTPQSMTVGFPFSTPLSARVTDANGAPLGGVDVVFAAPTSGATGTFATGGSTVTATTASDGRATPPAFTAGGEAGSYVVTATAAAGAPPARFILTNTLGPAAAVAAVDGTPQEAAVGMPFPSRLTAEVTDARAVPVAGVQVTFAAPATGTTGTFVGGASTATVVTGADGRATSPTITAGGSPGAFAVKADVGGGVEPATYLLTSVAGPPSTLTGVTGSGQATVIKTAFATALQVEVRDAYGNGLAGVVVTFSAPTNDKKATARFPGPSSSALVTTTAAGVATAPMLTANAKVGTYAVVASVPGVTAPVSFSLTNVRR